MSKQERLLHFIMKELENGNTFGRYHVTGEPYGDTDYITYGYFDRVLYKTASGYLGWSHYGSSAETFDIDGLKWTLEHIFKMSVYDFLEKYTVEKRH